MQYLDYIAGALELLGIYLVGSKNKVGFVFCIACNITWVLYVLMSDTAYGLLLVVLPAFFINIRNFRRWHREDETNTLDGKLLLRRYNK